MQVMQDHAISEVKDGVIHASVEIAAPPERVFAAMTSADICAWWVRPGVFDTRSWQGDVRVGGQWRTTGIGGGRPYELTGEFLELDPPHGLVHTWKFAGSPGAPSVVRYRLEPIPGGTRVTLEHSGVPATPAFENTRIGWQTSFDRLAEVLAG